MNKEVFLSQLKDRLSGFTKQEVKDIISYYDELITGAIDDGLSEEQAIENLGSIDSIVEQICIDYGLEYQTSNFDWEQIESNTGYEIELPQASNKKGYHQLKLEARQISSIRIDAKTSIVTVQTTNSNNISVEYFNKCVAQYSFAAQGETLIIKEEKSVWALQLYFSIAGLILAGLVTFILSYFVFDNKLETYFATGIPCLILYSLASTYFQFKDYSVKRRLTISLPQNCKLENVIIKNKSGTISTNNLVCKRAKLNVMSGLIKLNNLEIEQLLASASSGEIKVLDCKCLQTIELKNKSGSIRCENINTKSFLANLTSGIIKVENIVAGQAIMKGKSGNIKVSKIEANVIKSFVTSGSVKINQIKGKAQDYFIDGTIRSGSFKVNKLAGASIRNYMAKSGEKSISAGATSGTVRLNFVEQ